MDIYNFDHLPPLDPLRRHENSLHRSEKEDRNDNKKQIHSKI